MRSSLRAVLALELLASALLFWAGAGDDGVAAGSSLALVSGAGAAATVAARGWVRRVVGGVIMVVGVVATVASSSVGAWPGTFAGVMLLAAGVWTLARGPSWHSLSARYERAAAEPGPSALWDALDRGEDPTDGADDLPQ